MIQPHQIDREAVAATVVWSEAVIDEHLAHLRRKGDDASCMVIEYQAALIERLSAERERLAREWAAITPDNPSPYGWERSVFREAANPAAILELIAAARKGQTLTAIRDAINAGEAGQ